MSSPCCVETMQHDAAGYPRFSEGELNTERPESEGLTPRAPAVAGEQPAAGQTDEPGDESVGPVVSTTGHRQALRDIRRELSAEELANPGVQKLLLDSLDRADDECEVLRAYIPRYHEADKRAAVLEERLWTNKTVEIQFAVGLAIGSAIMGFTPSLWDGTYKGPLALAIGVVLFIGSIVARIVKR
jgi:hypothetical protein